MTYTDTGETWVYSTLWPDPFPGPGDFWHLIPA